MKFCNFFKIVVCSRGAAWRGLKRHIYKFYRGKSWDFLAGCLPSSVQARPPIEETVRILYRGLGPVHLFRQTFPFINITKFIPVLLEQEFQQTRMQFAGKLQPVVVLIGSKVILKLFVFAIYNPKLKINTQS